MPFKEFIDKKDRERYLVGGPTDNKRLVYFTSNGDWRMVRFAIGQGADDWKSALFASMRNRNEEMMRFFSKLNTKNSYQFLGADRRIPLEACRIVAEDDEERIRFYLSFKGKTWEEIVRENPTVGFTPYSFSDKPKRILEDIVVYDSLDKFKLYEPYIPELHQKTVEFAETYRPKKILEFLSEK